MILGIAWGFISKHEVEWGFPGRKMRAVIVYKFGHRDVIYPCFMVRATKEVEIGFNFLIELFSFSISLRVIGSGKGNFISRDL